MSDIFDRISPEQGDIFDRISQEAPAPRPAGARHSVLRHTAPLASGMFGGGAGLLETLNSAAQAIAKITGTTPGGAFDTAAEWLRKNQAKYQKIMEEEGTPKVERLVGEIVGSLPGGVAEWVTGVPTAALAGAGEKIAEGKPEEALGGAIRRGGERYILGRAFKALEPVESPVVRRGLTAATMMGATVLHGGSFKEAAASGALGVVLAGKHGRRVIRKPAKTPVTYMTPPDTSSAGVAAEPTFKPRIRIEGEVGRETPPTEKPIVPQETPARATQTSLPIIGAAQPPAAGEPISTRNVDTGMVRAEEGLPPLEGGPRRSLTEHQAIWTEAAPPPAAVDAIAEEILKIPRALTPAEEQGFRMRITDVRGQYDALTAEAGKLPPGSPELLNNLDARKQLREQNDKLTRATRLAGTEWSHTGLSRQNLSRLLDDETSPLAMTARAEEIKGDKLTDVERADVEAKAQKLKQAVEQRNARSQKVAERAANRAIRRERNRYAKMTEAEKDAELTDLIQKARENPENADYYFYQMAMNLGSRPGIKGVSDVAARLQQYFNEINRYSLSDAIVAATERQGRETTLLREQILALRREAKTDSRLRTAIEDVLWHLNEGIAPERPQPTPGTYNQHLQALRDVLAYYKGQLQQSTPVQKARRERILARLNARLASGDYGPRPGKVEKPLRDPEIERLDYQISRARQELNERIRKLDPWFKHPGQILPQFFREIQAWKSSVDMSALGRQGGVTLRSHPIRTLRRLPEAIRACFDPKRAFKIQNEIFNGERSWYYKRIGLDFTDYEGGLNSREELFAGTLIERVPLIGRLVRGSNRGFVTLLNMIRRDSYDAMERSFAKAGGLSLEEAKALAYYVNVTTGRGSMQGLEKYTATLNGTLWSPRFTVSRIQYLLGLPLWKAPTWRVRRAIALEYARYLTGVATTLWLYSHVFGGTVEQDPRSSDYGKIKFGNMRLDPLSGLSQVTVLLARQALGETKTQKGAVVPLSGPNLPYRGDTRRTILERFVRSKLGYAPGLVWDLFEGKDFIGQPITLGGELKGAIVPLGFEDVLKLMQDQGVPKGAALEVLNLLGEGVQVYNAPAESGPRGMHRKELRKRLRK